MGYRLMRPSRTWSPPLDRSLASPRQRKAAILEIATALSAEAKQDLATTLGQSLQSPELKKATVMDVATALPREQQKAAAHEIATALPTGDRKDVATAVAQSLPDPQRTEWVETTFGPLDSETREKSLPSAHICVDSSRVLVWCHGLHASLSE